MVLHKQSLRESSFVKLSALSLLLLGLLFSGCTAEREGNWEKIKREIRSSHPNVRQLSTAELQEWLDAKDSQTLIIDRREEEEYAVSHLPGAYLASGVIDTLEIIEKEGRDKFVVIYCSVGNRSSALVEQLMEKGYSNVYNLEGSIFKWANEGRPLYRGTAKVKVVHPYGSKWRHYLKKDLWHYPGKHE